MITRQIRRLLNSGSAVVLLLGISPRVTREVIGVALLRTRPTATSAPTLDENKSAAVHLEPANVQPASAQPRTIVYTYAAAGRLTRADYGDGPARDARGHHLYLR